jgi:transposase-like protein
MPAQRKYPEELRERAVKMVSEIRAREGKGRGEVARVARQLGVHRETLRLWVRQAEVDGGQRPGTSSEDARRIAELERENRELRLGPGGGGMVADLDIARWRLRSQHLVWPYAVSAGEAVGSLLAVQAENPSQAGWAVASRTQNPDQAELAALLDDGAVLRTHVLRPTWHFVRAKDIGWLAGLTGPRVRRVTGQQLRTAHGLDEHSIGHAVAAVTDALADRGQLTRAQLADELRDRGIAGSGQMLMILLAHAPLLRAGQTPF